MSFRKTLLQTIRDKPCTVSGLGMFQCHINENQRLTIWDSAFKDDPFPSFVHNHPWDFVSTIYKGELCNYCWSFTPCKEGEGAAKDRYDLYTINTKNSNVLERKKVLVRIERSSILHPYSSYQMDKITLHKTITTDGTITILTKFFTDHRHFADMLVTENDEWIDAKPHPATEEEIALAEYHLRKL